VDHRNEGWGQSKYQGVSTLTPNIESVRPLYARNQSLGYVTNDAEVFYAKPGLNVHERTVWHVLSVTVMEKEIDRLR